MARRREEHRSVALALEVSTMPNAGPADLGEIARHAEAAGERAMAYKYALAAYEAGLRRYAYEEARAWLDLAAEMAAGPEESSVVDRLTAELLDVAGWRETPPAPAAAPRPVGQLERADFDLPTRA
jgi:hypothetical protein